MLGLQVVVEMNWTELISVMEQLGKGLYQNLRMNGRPPID